MDLKDAREKIDNIDCKISKLLDERAKVVKDIALFKAVNGMDIFDSARESEKLDAIDSPEKRRIFERIMEVSRDSQKLTYGLLGKHLSHSFSKDIHERYFGYSYEYFQLDEKDLPSFFKNRRFKGINVTIPYKKEVIKYLDELTDEAREIGSVNLVLNEGGKLKGYNTDIYGFRRLLEKVPDFESAVILGDGGASACVKYALKGKKVKVLGRKELGQYEGADLVVNATPCGMFPNVDEVPVDISNCKAVIDLVYNPYRTELMLNASEKGITAIGGLEMLFYQAIGAKELFTGEKLSPLEEALLYDRFEREYMNIALIGMPGSGKSTFGKKLAKDLGKTFVDLDDEIYSREGQTAEEIILFRGEDAFRDIETKVLGEISLRHNAVISTGGGIVERDENRRLLLRNSNIWYLKRDLEDLEVFGRPLSMEKGVEKLFEERGEKYQAWSQYIIEEE